ncbi:MAG TPA: type II toxin-antitoxin system HicB family antitoxin [Candidatus Saccharimonadales bacterium]|nr:type II toxin-antitoxin system HicB family antitoxin [Candidatus Saccharimonadales bacterium]
MEQTRHVTAIIEREDGGYVALCPELDVASQGVTIEEARQNLAEAVELLLETASTEEVRQRTWICPGKLSHKKEPIVRRDSVLRRSHRE